MRPYLAYLGGSASPSEEAMQLLASAGTIDEVQEDMFTLPVHVVASDPESESMCFLNASDEGPVATDRYKTCVQYVQTILPIALGRLFAAHILPEYTKVCLLLS